MNVTVADVEAAVATVNTLAIKTPMLESRILAEMLGVPVQVKCENLQRAGSFKVRGAIVRLDRLSPQEKAAGVIAASAGNHAQGVAVAAAKLGIPATVYMPVGAAIPKVQATRSYGATVRFHGANLGEAMTAAKLEAEHTGAVFVHPYDHPDIVAGQGTVALEILEQMPEVANVVVPVGGGGLVAGIAAVLAERAPHVKVIGVQAQGAPAFGESLAAGHVVSAAEVLTMADGIAVPTPGELPLQICHRAGVQMRYVNEEDLSHALVVLAERLKLVVEPAGAAGVASILAEPSGYDGPTAVVLSGGNLDPLLLLRVIRHGLSAAKRFLQLRLIVKDSPGRLAGVLVEVAALGASILDVTHSRTWDVLAVDEVGLSLEIETRGPEHCDEVVSRLRELGYHLL